jgi:hypothetical protein
MKTLAMEQYTSFRGSSQSLWEIGDRPSAMYEFLVVISS